MKKKVKGILNIFKDKNNLGCEFSSKKEAFKLPRKTRVIMMGVVGLHISYQHCVIPTDFRVWLV